jgi:hypothetical protein
MKLEKKGLSWSYLTVICCDPSDMSRNALFLKNAIIYTEGLKASTANFVLSGTNEDMSNISGYKSQINLNIWRPYTAEPGSWMRSRVSQRAIASNRNAPRHGRSGNGYYKNIPSVSSSLYSVFFSDHRKLLFPFLISANSVSLVFWVFLQGAISELHRSEYC